MDKFKLNTIEEAIEDFRNGEFIIVVDDEDRENEGDFIIAAEKITPEKVNFMLKNGRGVLCVPITMSRCKELQLDPQVSANTSLLGTPFTVTVDKIEGCSTGVSTEDRAATIKALADPTSTPRDICSSRTHQPPLCTGQGCTPPRRTHRGRHRYGTSGRTQPLCSPHRDYERGRYNGTYAAAHRNCKRAQP